MIAEGRDCRAVLIQLMAVISSLKNTGKDILKNHLKTCVVNAALEKDAEFLSELDTVIDQCMK